MSADLPKCPACKGFGCDLEAHPLKACAKCNGTGRPTKKQEELLDG